MHNALYKHPARVAERNATGRAFDHSRLYYSDIFRGKRSGEGNVESG